MGAAHNERAVPALAGNDPFKSDRLGGAVSVQAYNERSAACQSLRRLTARLDAMVIWRDDLQRRIEHAQELQERGSLFAQEQDDLIDGLRAWRLAAAGVGLELNGADDMRRTS